MSKQVALALVCCWIGSAVSGQEVSAPVRIETGVSGHIHPALCITKKGTLVAVYCKSEYKPYLITRSTDGGKTWSTPTLFEPTAKMQVYPGSLTTLADGRLVHAWNVWYPTGEKLTSRYVAYALSADDGVTWSEPKSLAKNSDQKVGSVIRHPILELSATQWILPLIDRTVLYNPETGQETAFGDGRNHGLVPIVRTAQGTLVSGKGLRSTDGGKTWQEIKPFPDVASQGWRQQMIALKNGWLLASQIVGPGVGGEKINFVVSRDDGQSWDMGHPIEFYNPGRQIGGRACPRSVEIDDRTLGTIFYDTDGKQPGGSGVFFRTMPIKLLAAPNRDTLLDAARHVRQIIGHRGSSADRPENTLASYRRAIEASATALEADIRTSKDGALVSIHDADVRRTTDGKGLVREMTLAELQRLDAGRWFDAKYAGERIPTLREILELCRGKIDVMLDLQEPGEEYAQRITNEVRTYGEPKRIVLGIRSLEHAQLFRKFLPEAKQVGLIPTPDTIESFAKAGVDTIRLWTKWVEKDSSLVPRVRQCAVMLHLNGTTGGEDEVRMLLQYRPESLAADDPGRMVQSLAHLAGQK
jgi:glycerophosphoryl diester phosphodiesterase